MDCVTGESMDASSSAADVDTGDFECNICFDLAREPIATLCGHLYCWPCLCQWLLHSHCHECPVCKAIVQEDKLIPIYGRGKSTSDPRSRAPPGVTFPNRPLAQTPQQTGLRLDMNYARPNVLDQIAVANALPMSAARLSFLTLSTLFGSLPAIFNLQVHGFHDATVYGSTSGVPYMFSSSFHGGFVHGFHNYHSAQIEWKPILKAIFLVVGFFVALHLILA